MIRGGATWHHVRRTGSQRLIGHRERDEREQQDNHSGEWEHYDLGGGNDFLVKFGSDASFGIVWGNQSDPNNIYFVSYIARYLGDINVDANGTSVYQQPVKIYTLYAVKLDRLIEYSNSSTGGMLNYSPMVGDAFKDLIGLGSNNQIYKGVDLNTAWTFSNYTNGEDSNGNLTWTFTLTATNLSYVYNTRIATNPIGDGKLSSVALTFHLTASAKYVNNVSEPQWNISLESRKDGMPYLSSPQSASPLSSQVMSQITT